MPVSLPGMLLLIGLATAAASIVTVVLMLKNPPLNLARLCAILVPVFVSSAAVAYCCGWFAVALGGPFPAQCEDRNTSGAELVSMVQEYWPLRSACFYLDGAVVEHIPMSLNVLVCLSAGLAVVLACAGAVLHRRTPSAT
ncbi:hypothetical protein [Streptomyces sp. NPDC001876]|uniref:hypothetical protein n=1 Tax=Streptomyces sp. NPDC001876 TaxID=3154402 RepID=UPI003330F8D7